MLVAHAAGASSVVTIQQSTSSLLPLVSLTMSRVLVIALFALAALASAENGLPSNTLNLHASCRLTWTFPANCTVANQGLVESIKRMANDNCGTSERCLYSLVSSSAETVQAVHETPVKHYKDKITLGFSAKGSGCSVSGYSTSEVWYAVLDDGTNYCNLHNLVTASGLQFQEDVDTSDCTQYSSANCDKY